MLTLFERATWRPGAFIESAAGILLLEENKFTLVTTNQDEDIPTLVQQVLTRYLELVTPPPG